MSEASVYAQDLSKTQRQMCQNLFSSSLGSQKRVQVENLDSQTYLFTLHDGQIEIGYLIATPLTLNRVEITQMEITPEYRNQGGSGLLIGRVTEYFGLNREYVAELAFDNFHIQHRIASEIYIQQMAIQGREPISKMKDSVLFVSKAHFSSQEKLRLEEALKRAVIYTPFYRAFKNVGIHLINHVHIEWKADSAGNLYPQTTIYLKK